jgi:hypothetical protein
METAAAKAAAVETAAAKAAAESAARRCRIREGQTPDGRRDYGCKCEFFHISTPVYASPAKTRPCGRAR